MYEITRRELIFSSAAAAAAFGLNGRLAFLGVAHAQTATERGFHRYSVGSIEVTALYDGVWEKAHDPAFIVASTSTVLAELRAVLGARGGPSAAATARSGCDGRAACEK